MKFTQLLAALKGGSTLNTPPLKERRKSERVPAQEPAVLCWKDHLDLPTSLPVTLMNVSSGGVAFSCPEHLSPGQAIVIETATRCLDCVVRHVRTMSRGYYMGAEIISSSAGTGLKSSIKDLADDLSQE